MPELGAGCEASRSKLSKSEPSLRPLRGRRSAWCGPLRDAEVWRVSQRQLTRSFWVTKSTACDGPTPTLVMLIEGTRCQSIVRTLAGIAD